MTHEDDEYDDDREAPDASEQDRGREGDGSVDTVACPYCGAPIYEQAEVCPNCGSFIVDEDVPRRRPLWVLVALGAVLIAILLHWVFRRP